MLLEKNIHLAPPIEVSDWRKTALGTYAMTGDCQVYCLQTIDIGPALKYVEESGGKFGLTQLVGKACGLVVRDNPEINRVLRFGRFYPREEVSVFFQVAMDSAGKELSGHTVRNIDRMSPPQIQKDMSHALSRMKNGEDIHYKKAKRVMGKTPSLVLKPLLYLYGLILYGLNIWSPLFGAPKDAFGSMMITNIGNLGVRTAFAPLVPYSRCPLILALGEVYEKVVAKDGKIGIQKSVDCCWTTDHRVIDGVVGAKMAKQFEGLMLNPKLLRN